MRSIFHDTITRLFILGETKDLFFGAVLKSAHLLSSSFYLFDIFPGYHNPNKVVIIAFCIGNGVVNTVTAPLVQFICGSRPAAYRKNGEVLKKKYDSPKHITNRAGNVLKSVWGSYNASRYKITFHRLLKTSRQHTRVNAWNTHDSMRDILPIGKLFIVSRKPGLKRRSALL